MAFLISGQTPSRGGGRGNVGTFDEWGNPITNQIYAKDAEDCGKILKELLDSSLTKPKKTKGK